MQNDPQRAEAVHLLTAELANIRVLSEALERLGQPVPIEAEIALMDLERQIADILREPTRQ